MKIFGWWKKKKTYQEEAQPDKDDRGICPDCGGQGYSINDNIVLWIMIMNGGIQVVGDVMEQDAIIPI